jgi:hypothetical protein
MILPKRQFRTVSNCSFIQMKSMMQQVSLTLEQVGLYFVLFIETYRDVLAKIIVKLFYWDALYIGQHSSELTGFCRAGPLLRMMYVRNLKNVHYSNPSWCLQELCLPEGLGTCGRVTQCGTRIDLIFQMALRSNVSDIKNTMQYILCLFNSKVKQFTFRPQFYGIAQKVV